MKTETRFKILAGLVIAGMALVQAAGADHCRWRACTDKNGDPVCCNALPRPEAFSPAEKIFKFQPSSYSCVNVDTHELSATIAIDNGSDQITVQVPGSVGFVGKYTLTQGACPTRTCGLTFLDFSAMEILRRPTRVLPRTAQGYLTDEDGVYIGSLSIEGLTESKAVTVQCVLDSSSAIE